MKPPKQFTTLRTYLNTIILVSCLALIPLLSFGQRAGHQYTLNEEDEIIRMRHLGDGGLIMQTGPESFKEKDAYWTIRYFTKEMEEGWSVEVDKLFTKKTRGNILASTVNASHVYHIEPLGWSRGGTSVAMNIVQILMDGTTTIKELEEISDFGYLRTVFCTDSFLVFLATVNGKDDNQQLLGKEKLIMHKMSHDNMNLKTISLELPEIEDSKNATFWRYIGTKNNTFYLSSKHVNSKTGGCSIHLVQFNLAGDVLQDVHLTPELSGMSLHPSENVKSFNGADQLEDFDYEFHESQNDVSIKIKPGAYGCLKMDEFNGAFYFYGIYGPKPFRLSGSKITGCFTIKYDLNGKEVWNFSNELPQAISKRNYSGSMDILNYPYMWLYGYPDHDLSLRLSFPRHLQSYELRADGGLESESYSNIKTWKWWEYYQLTRGALPDTELTKYLRSIPENKGKEYQVFFYNSSYGDALILNNKKSGVLKIFY